MDDADPIIPHPRAAERAFVLSLVADRPERSSTANAWANCAKAADFADLDGLEPYRTPNRSKPGSSAGGVEGS